MLNKIFRSVHLINKFFSKRTYRYFTTTLKEEKILNKEVPLLNPYLQESLISISNNKLKDPQTNIIESINKNSHSMILCDEFSGRKYSCALGIMNRIINSKEDEKESDSSSENEEFFINTLDVYKKSKERADDNKVKKFTKPKGALIICQKFEFATHFYRICRKLDFKNKLRMVRVGTSLHTVSPTVELDVIIILNLA